ncbi:PREDICTED: transcription factor Pur-alpha 1-like isoform X2 [Populus euphratica]|uniref:Transcription factor Pur-alpha 1-like isoform X2 n=1 Tax=Populus euphratica TaxID=75702 RepID=A0AAJ6XX80_POPEU|nr:PREDICTED: transcription factor Pur-alpha 1-like isoform X2 [Populus euphratica]
MEMEKNSLDTDVLLVRKKIEIDHSSFCFDLKENSERQYLQISQMDGFSILLLSSGISCFLKAFDCFSSTSFEHQEEGSNRDKELKINGKVFCFSAGQDHRGPFLKVSEALTSTDRKSIVIPCRKNKNNGLQLFMRTLQEIDTTARVLFPPYQQQIYILSEQSVELENAKTKFIMSHNAQSSSTSQSNKEFARYESSRYCDSKIMRVGQKQFCFDLGNNEKGHFLKISEERGTCRSSVIIPLSQLKQFNEMTGHFLDITNDSYSREGHLIGRNFKKYNPPQVSKNQVLNAEDESYTVLPYES